MYNSLKSDEMISEDHGEDSSYKKDNELESNLTNRLPNGKLLALQLAALRADYDTQVEGPSGFEVPKVSKVVKGKTPAQLFYLKNFPIFNETESDFNETWVGQTEANSMIERLEKKLPPSPMALTNT